MDIQLLTRFFAWCTIINIVLLSIFSLLWISTADFIFKLHGKWFQMPRETFNMIYYCFIGLYKIFLIVFNLVPLIALLVIT
jgi:hypothetical protein